MCTYLIFVMYVELHVARMQTKFCISCPHHMKSEKKQEESAERNRYTTISALRNFTGGGEVAKSDYYIRQFCLQGTTKPPLDGFS